MSSFGSLTSVNPASRIGLRKDAFAVPKRSGRSYPLTSSRSAGIRIVCTAEEIEGQQARTPVQSLSRSTVQKALQDLGFNLGSGPAPDSDIRASTELITPKETSFTWEEWEALIQCIESDETRSSILREQLDAAVLAERYSEAAKCKQQMEESQARNFAEISQKELDDAIREERYDDAAEVRDSTAVGLQGWWAGGPQDDPYGHVLHISRAYGRFVARAYTPSNLAEMKGWTESNPLRQDEGPAMPINLGQTVMELYLQKNAEQQWEQQAVVLQHSDSLLSSIDIEDDKDRDSTLAADLKGISTDPFVNPLASMDEAENYAAIRAPASLMKINRSQFVVVPEKQRRSDNRTAGPQGSSSGLYVSPSNPQSETPDEFTIVTKGNDDETVRMPLADFMKSIDDDEDSSDSWGRVADAVAEMQDRLSEDSKVPHIDREELAEGIRNAIEELVENGAVDEHLAVEVKVEEEAKAEPADQYITKPATYTRIESTAVPTDPLSGLYLGAFGPHGPEVLNINPTIDEDGSPAVEGIKVTGDPNVPAGQISFKAKVGRKYKLKNSDEYPEELGVIARYKGEGCVAQPGFTNPKWVDGELLVFSTGSSTSGSITGGAELGFVWSMPDGKKFLILMNRVDLDDLISCSYA